MDHSDLGIHYHLRKAPSRFAASAAHILARQHRINDGEPGEKVHGKRPRRSSKADEAPEDQI